MTRRHPLIEAGLTSASVLVLTSLHHLYGAWRFDTPWRAHVVHVAFGAGALLAVCLFVAWGQRGRRVGHWACGAFLLITTLVCVGWLGLYEGAYNHGLKNVLYFAGVSPDVFEMFFPRSIYEPPGDWVFEVSGVLQCPLGLFAGRSAWCLFHGAGTSSGEAAGLMPSRKTAGRS